MLPRIVLLLCLIVVSSPKPSPCQVTPSAAQEETDSKKSEDKTPVKNETYWDKVRSAEVLPIWLSAVGTLLAVVAAGFTLRVLFIQTKSGKDAADAALLNAKALINAERPWLMIQIDREYRPSDDDRKFAVFPLSVFNYGKSPAHVSRIQTVEYYFLDLDKGLTVPPDYGKAGSAQYFVGPNLKSGPFWTVDPNHEIAVMSRRVAAGRADSAPDDMKLVVWGLVEYGDGVFAKTYETSFCYQYQRTATEIELVMCGPKEYNRYT